MSTSTTSVSTGTVATTGSKTYVVGTASGIDTTALVDAAYAQKTAAADTIDAKVTANTAKITAYKTMQSLTTSLQTALTDLKASYGYGVTDTSVYGQKQAYLAASDGTNTDNVMSVTVSDTAEKGTHTIEVEQLAKAMKVTATEASSKTTALGLTGSFSIGLDGDTATNIDVTSTMTLQDIATAINNSSATSGVSASVIKSSDSGYTLVMTGTETGKTIDYSSTSGTDIMNSLGVTGTDGSFSNITQAAQPAKIKLDGLEISGSDNVFDDLLDGVSISLVGAAPGTDITLDVDNDYTSTKDAISAFVDAYNNLRDFITTNQTVASDGTVSDDAVLFSDNLLKSLTNTVSSMIGGATDSTSIATLADMGITLDDDNKLEISDETKLNNALLNNYDDIQKFFQTSVTSDSDNLLLLRNTSTASSMSFALDITTDENGAITGASVNGDSSAFTIDGSRLIGKTGSAYEGLTFVYAGTSSTTINIDLNQGLADKLYNAMGDYSSTTTGSVQSAIDQLDQSNTKLDSEASDIRDRADAFRDKLVTRYATMESNISAANLLLKQVQAILGNQSSDSN
ncbi:MAG: flagellar filament capping protein FliD [Micavibrio sp.]|nr:flagellar filament capping protein FliD [Micavibrio sp.]